MFQLSQDVPVFLLDFLREHLGLTATKKGCDQGGAGTVLVDGERILSCLALAAPFAGRSVVTVEGLVASSIRSVSCPSRRNRDASPNGGIGSTFDALRVDPHLAKHGVPDNRRTGSRAATIPGDGILFASRPLIAEGSHQPTR